MKTTIRVLIILWIVWNFVTLFDPNLEDVGCFESGWREIKWKLRF